jgi:hypothetical protein
VKVVAGNSQLPEGPLGRLTERESDILRKAGERVFALSKRLADQERESDRYQTEAQSLRELLAESREVRKVLSDQISSLYRELDREYEERSELRRLLASLHVQMQELLPVVTGLSRSQQLGAPERPQPQVVAPSKANGVVQTSLARRLFAAAGEVAGSGQRKKRRR